VSNVIDACKALTHMDATIDASSWIHGGIDGKGGQGASPLFSSEEIVGFANGLLHVPTRTLLDHSPTFFSQNCLPYAYDAKATFLSEIWPGDEDSIGTLQEVTGYIIRGDTSLQEIFLIIGSKRSERAPSAG